MRVRRFVVLWCLAVGLVSIAGCAPAAVKSVWKLEDYEGRFSKVLVVVQFPDEGEGTLVEEAMVVDLTGRGVEAVAGGIVLPDRPVLDRNEMYAVMADRGFDGALVVYFVGTSYLKTIFPAMVGATQRTSQQIRIVTKGASTTAKVVTVEADLYDLASKRRVWFVVTETVVTGDLTSDEKALASLMDALGDSLARKDLLAR